MIERDHLQVYELTLTTKGLVHIGSGRKLPRKEYIFTGSRQRPMVAFLDEQAFFDMLIQNELVDAFEMYCMQPGGDLSTFLFKDCRLTREQVKPAILYEVNASDAMDEEHSLKDIECFMRDAHQRAYIPGSSVKGAIRTAMLFSLLSKEPVHKDFPRKKGFDIKTSYLPEEGYFNTLGLTDPRRAGDAVNSIMRGIQISDSQPIDNHNMALALKMDVMADGRINVINLCRECVAPGTRIKFQMTLDQSILKGEWTVQKILQAIEAFAKYQSSKYVGCFDIPLKCEQPTGGNILMLGGGAGFFSKSLAYPYLGINDGLKWTSKYLDAAFNKHKHWEDEELGISPHTLKYGKYMQQLSAFGACEVMVR